MRHLGGKGSRPARGRRFRPANARGGGAAADADRLARDFVDALRSSDVPRAGERDPYAAPRFGQRLAERTGARYLALPGCSHWWQLERPGDVAVELRRLWASAG